MKHFVRVLSLAAILSTSTSLAGYVPLTPSSLSGTPAQEMWSGIYGTVTNSMHWVTKRFAKGKDFATGSREEQCLRKNMTDWHLGQIGHFMKGRTYSQEALEMIRKLLNGSNDWCSPDGSGQENEGLAAFRKFQASLTPAASKSFRVQVQEELEKLSGRPLAPAEVAAVIAAALVTAPIWALP